MTSPRWTRLSIPSVLVMVLARLMLAARSDRNMVSEEYVGATVNATVLDGRGHAIHVMSSNDGMYGQNSPKVDTRGVVVVPVPHHGGTAITHTLSSNTHEPPLQFSSTGTADSKTCRHRYKGRH